MLRAVYRRVWADAQARGAIVRYQDLWPVRRGLFRPRERVIDGNNKAEPEVSIYRHGCNARTPMLDLIATLEIEAELWTLSHECGHFLWWKRGWDGDSVARAERCEYFVALRHYEAIEKVLPKASGTPLTDAEYTRRLGASMRRELSIEERRLILAEEQRAWDIGRGLLQSHGAEDLIHYNARAIVDVNHYFVRLGLVGVDSQPRDGTPITGIQGISDVDVRSLARKMQRLGPPTLRVILDCGRYYAVEGTHRMAAASSLGYRPTFVVIADDNTPGDVPVKVDYGVQTVSQLRAAFVVDNPCVPMFTF